MEVWLCLSVDDESCVYAFSSFERAKNFAERDFDTVSHIIVSRTIDNPQTTLIALQ